MSTEPQPSPAPASSAVAERERKARGAFRYYEVMAFVTGTMLLLLCVEMILKYGFGVDEPWLNWIPFAHGWIYVIYLVTVFNLWSTMRWSLGRVLALVAGGVVPVLSFVMERRAQAWFDADLPGLLQRVAHRTR